MGAALPIGNRRYSRLETCATKARLGAKHIQRFIAGLGGGAGPVPQGRQNLWTLRSGGARISFVPAGLWARGLRPPQRSIAGLFSVVPAGLGQATFGRSTPALPGRLSSIPPKPAKNLAKPSKLGAMEWRQRNKFEKRPCLCPHSIASPPSFAIASPTGRKALGVRLK